MNIMEDLYRHLANDIKIYTIYQYMF